MKNIVVAFIISVVFGSSLFAQNTIDSVLAQIERNSTTLSALQKRCEANTMGNNTGNFLQNPEFEFHYLWGNPASTGNRTDINVKQSFDFPTAYSYKHQISTIKNEQVELEYQKQRQELLLQASLICFDLIYTNALVEELSKRQKHAKSIVLSYKLKLAAGETNILEVNKAQLNLLSLSKEKESLSIEKEALLGELTRLNGGVVINFSDTVFETLVITPDFEEWYVKAEQSNPLLNWLKKEVELSQKQVSLNKALSLPKFQAGYMSESVIGQEFQGISVGLSVPLWENKNRVKYAKAIALATEYTASDKKLQFYNHLKILHQKAKALQSNAADYRTQLQSFNNNELLKKALDKGQITLIDYFLELSIYYESMNNLLEIERDMNTSLAELNHYLL